MVRYYKKSIWDSQKTEKEKIARIIKNTQNLQKFSWIYLCTYIKIKGKFVRMTFRSWEVLSKLHNVLGFSEGRGVYDF